MANTPEITIRNGTTGKVAIVNGKTYNLLRYYQDEALEGIVFLAVAGRVPLRADDLADHWQVFRSGNVYLALAARAFSYQLIEGEGATTDAPKWPRLKTPGEYYAFVGPTEAAVTAQITLTLERYHAALSVDEALDRVMEVPDLCGGPPAYLLRADCL